MSREGVNTEVSDEIEELSEEIQEPDMPEKVYHEEPFGEKISIDPKTQKKMNIFLSYFSEAYMYRFDQDDYDMYDMFRWVEIWCRINKRRSIEYGHRPGDESGDMYEKISLENINYVTDKYFGYTYSNEEASRMHAGHEETDQLFYEDGYLYSPAGDGESYTYLSVVSGAEDLGNNKLKLYYNVFSQDIEAYLDGRKKDYSLTYEEATANPEYEKMDAGYAVVRIDNDLYKLEYLEQYDTP